MPLDYVNTKKYRMTIHEPKMFMNIQIFLTNVEDYFKIS